jgi:enamine deaminase RidA (YjgF/YER057c/UK114 family)
VLAAGTTCPRVPPGRSRRRADLRIRARFLRRRRAPVPGQGRRDLDLPAAREAARLAVLGCLVSLEQVLGTLNAVERIVKVNGYVHCVPGYEPLPLVTDGASELLKDLFGQRGRHARTTVGVASLPSGVAVELELAALVRHLP